MSKLMVTELVFSYIKPTVLLLKYFGLAPITYELKNGYYFLEGSKSYVIYSYLIAIILGSWAMIGFWSDVSAEKSFRAKEKNDVYLTFADIGGVILSVLFGILMSPFKLKALFNIIQRLQNIQYILNESPENLRRDRNKANSIIAAVYIISIPLLLLDLYAWVLRAPSPEVSVNYIRNYTAFYLFYVVLLTLQLSYCNMTFYVKKRLMSFNAAMREEIDRKSKFAMEKNLEEKMVWNLKYKKGDIFEKFILNEKNIGTTSDIARKKVGNFLKIHMELFNCIESINDYFDYPLLFIIITCFSHLVITAWGILVTNYTKWLFWILNMLWMLIHSARFIFAVEPTHRCLVEMTGSVVTYLVIILQLHNKHRSS